MCTKKNIYLGEKTDCDFGSVARTRASEAVAATSVARTRAAEDKGERQQGNKEKVLKNEISMRPGGRGGVGGGGGGGGGGRGRGEGGGGHQEYDRKKNEKWKTDTARADLSDFEHAAQGIF